MIVNDFVKSNATDLWQPRPSGIQFVVVFTHLVLFRLYIPTMASASLASGSSLPSEKSVSRIDDGRGLPSSSVSDDGWSVDARVQELLQPLPAPWMEERRAQGISSLGRCSLTELLKAPVSKKARSSDSTSTFACDSTKRVKILPDSLSGCQPSGMQTGCMRGILLTSPFRALRARHDAPRAEGPAGLSVLTDT